MSRFPARTRIRAFGEQLYYTSVMPAECGSRARLVDPFGAVIAQASSFQTEQIDCNLDFKVFPLRGTPSFHRRRQVFWETVPLLQNAQPDQSPQNDSGEGE